jgi:hypothetical protein
MKAIPQDAKMTTVSGAVLNLRRPHHAKVMKTFDASNSKIGARWGQEIAGRGGIVME